MNEGQFLDICKSEFVKVKAEMMAGRKPPHALVIVGIGHGERVGGKLVLPGRRIEAEVVESIGYAFAHDLTIRTEMVIHVGDVWYVEAEARLEGVMPSEHPNRKQAVTFNGIMRYGRGVSGFLPYDETDDGRLAVVMDDAQEPVKLVDAAISEVQYFGGDHYKLYDRIVSAFLAGVERAEKAIVNGGLIE